MRKFACILLCLAFILGLTLVNRPAAVAFDFLKKVEEAAKSVEKKLDETFDKKNPGSDESHEEAIDQKKDLNEVPEVAKQTPPKKNGSVVDSVKDQAGDMYKTVKGVLVSDDKEAPDAAKAKEAAQAPADTAKSQAKQSAKPIKEVTRKPAKAAGKSKSLADAPKAAKLVQIPKEAAAEPTQKAAKAPKNAAAPVNQEVKKLSEAPKKDQVQSKQAPEKKAVKAPEKVEPSSSKTTAAAPAVGVTHGGVKSTSSGPAPQAKGGNPINAKHQVVAEGSWISCRKWRNISIWRNPYGPKPPGAGYCMATLTATLGGKGKAVRLRLLDPNSRHEVSRVSVYANGRPQSNEVRSGTFLVELEHLKTNEIKNAGLIEIKPDSKHNISADFGTAQVTLNLKKDDGRGSNGRVDIIDASTGKRVFHGLPRNMSIYPGKFIFKVTNPSETNKQFNIELDLKQDQKVELDVVLTTGEKARASGIKKWREIDWLVPAGGKATKVIPEKSFKEPIGRVVLYASVKRESPPRLKVRFRNPKTGQIIEEYEQIGERNPKGRYVKAGKYRLEVEGIDGGRKLNLGVVQIEQGKEFKRELNLKHINVVVLVKDETKRIEQVWLSFKDPASGKIVKTASGFPPFVTYAYPAKYSMELRHSPKHTTPLAVIAVDASQGSEVKASVTITKEMVEKYRKALEGSPVKVAQTTEPKKTASAEQPRTQTSSQWQLSTQSSKTDSFNEESLIPEDWNELPILFKYYKKWWDKFYGKDFKNDRERKKYLIFNSNNPEYFSYSSVYGKDKFLTFGEYFKTISSGREIYIVQNGEGFFLRFNGETCMLPISCAEVRKENIGGLDCITMKLEKDTGSSSLYNGWYDFWSKPADEQARNMCRKREEKEFLAKEQKKHEEKQKQAAKGRNVLLFDKGEANPCGNRQKGMFGCYRLDVKDTDGKPLKYSVEYKSLIGGPGGTHKKPGLNGLAPGKTQLVLYCQGQKKVLVLDVKADQLIEREFVFPAVYEGKVVVNGVMGDGGIGNFTCALYDPETGKEKYSWTMGAGDKDVPYKVTTGKYRLKANYSRIKTEKDLGLIEVKKGQTITKSVVFEIGTASFTFYDAKGKMLGPQVRIVGGDSGKLVHTMTSAPDPYVFRLAPGKYKLQAKRGYNGKPKEMEFSIKNKEVLVKDITLPN